MEKDKVFVYEFLNISPTRQRNILRKYGFIGVDKTFDTIHRIVEILDFIKERDYLDKILDELR